MRFSITPCLGNDHFEVCLKSMTNFMSVWERVPRGKGWDWPIGQGKNIQDFLL
jgi:hypothetical protein